MASDESDDGYGFNHHHPHHHSLPTHGQALSRLSVCSSSFTCGNDEDEECDDVLFFGDVDMSRLSLESFDADEELSDEQKTEMSSGSDEERECYSLPATPPRRRRGRVAVLKDYASETEARAPGVAGKPRKGVRRRAARERPAGGGTGRRDDGSWNGVMSGESEGGCGVMVMARPKGGRRPLCMDLEEVKACRDLGFELEHEKMLEMPSRMSGSGSTLDTNSSGSNSPISTWRISSPGDDPRDVKARLKVWAQAVALVSASQATPNIN